MRRRAYKSVVRLFAVIAVAAVALFLAFVFQGSFNNVARATIQWIIDNGQWIVARIYRIIIHYQLSAIH